MPFKYLILCKDLVQRVFGCFQCAIFEEKTGPKLQTGNVLILLEFIQIVD